MKETQHLKQFHNPLVRLSYKTLLKQLPKCLLFLEIIFVVSLDYIISFLPFTLIRKFYFLLESRKEVSVLSDKCKL